MGPGRVHITGASGAGVTTLGRALAQHYALPQFDADDFYWLPTAEPFTEKRPVEDRVALLTTLIGERSSVVLSGSISGWGDSLIAGLDAVVFLRTHPDLRLERLQAREAGRFGEAVVREDGARYRLVQSFLNWAEHYDDPEFTGRSLVKHRQWLAKLPCPVIELDGGRPAEALARQAIRALNALGGDDRYAPVEAAR